MTREKTTSWFITSFGKANFNQKFDWLTYQLTSFKSHLCAGVCLRHPGPFARFISDVIGEQRYARISTSDSFSFELSWNMTKPELNLSSLIKNYRY